MSIKTTIGVKYDSDRDIADIAKLVRKDIKTAVKARALPEDLKATVRISRYSMGQSLTVTVTACKGPILNKRRMLWDAKNPHRGHCDLPREDFKLYSDESDAITKTIEGIVNTYNHVARDTEPTDYYNCTFHLTVQFDHALEREERTAFEEEFRCVMAEVTEPPEPEKPKTGEKPPGRILRFFPAPGPPGLN